MQGSMQGIYFEYVKNNGSNLHFVRVTPEGKDLDSVIGTFHPSATTGEIWFRNTSIDDIKWYADKGTGFEEIPAGDFLNLKDIKELGFGPGYVQTRVLL